MNKHDTPYYPLFLLIGWLIMLSSCQPAPSHILKKAMQMENVSTDSIFFYLQQIEEPGKLPLKDQGDYSTKQLCGKPERPMTHYCRSPSGNMNKTSSKPNMYGHASSKAPPIYIAICPIPHY